MWFGALEEAQVHREVAVAILQGVLRERGSKKRLAQRVGITPQYLSYLLDPFDYRTPSPETARKLVRALPLTREEREELLEHLLLARARRAEAFIAFHHAERLPPHIAEEMIQVLSIALKEAQFGADSEKSRRGYRFVYEGGYCLATHVNPIENPWVFIHASFLAHDAACVLNRHADALYLMKRLAYVPPDVWLDIAGDRKQAVGYQVHVHLAQATVYYNLGNTREATAHCEQAEKLLITPHTGTAELQHRWFPHLYRDRLNILAKTRRFSLAQAERWADQIPEALERSARSEEERELLTFLGYVSLSRVYVRRGNNRNLRKAERILRSLQERVRTLSYIGPLHYTLLFRRMAELHKAKGDMDGWHHFIAMARQEAIAAGLSHQLREIQRELEGKCKLPGHMCSSGFSSLAF